MQPFGEIAIRTTLNSAVVLGLGAALCAELEVENSGPGEIIVTYYESEAYPELAQVLAASGVFEGIAESVTSVVALPVDLEAEFTECGEANAFYSDGSVVMCYEFFDLFTEFFVGLSDDPFEYLHKSESWDRLLAPHYRN